ncbi:MAG TPA: hypothetical protein PLK30_00480 [Blastocatellia bacterium]|nr:hypothetical protein [Blastocatellia bacterium]
MLQIYYHVLFAGSALFNLTMAAMLIFKPDFMLARLEIRDPAARLLAQSFASSVAAWGIGYALIAFDQQTFHNFAWLGVISKTIFFLIYFVALKNGRLKFAAFVPALIDLILAGLFAEFLWRTSN